MGGGGGVWLQEGRLPDQPGEREVVLEVLVSGLGVFVGGGVGLVRDGGTDGGGGRSGGHEALGVMGCEGGGADGGAGVGVVDDFDGCGRGCECGCGWAGVAIDAAPVFFGIRVRLRWRFPRGAASLARRVLRLICASLGMRVGSVAGERGEALLECPLERFSRFFVVVFRVIGRAGAGRALIIRLLVWFFGIFFLGGRGTMRDARTLTLQRGG